MTLVFETEASPTPTPCPSSDAEQALIAELGRLIVEPPASGGILTLDPVIESRRVWLDAVGLHEARFPAEITADDTDPWHPGNLPDWAGVGWIPAPKLVALSAKAGTEAALVQIGAHAALGIRCDEHTQWWYLRSRTEDLVGAFLAAGLPGHGDVLDVVACTKPSEIDGPTVADGRRLRRQVQPLVATMPGGKPTTAMTELAHQVWSGGTSPLLPTPAAGQLPNELVCELLDRVDTTSTVTRATVGIGARVQERWRVGLEETTITYDLEPGEQVAHLTCQATGRPARMLRLDRSGHLVLHPTTCAYCGGKFCGRCVPVLRGCGVCAIDICVSCAAPTEGQVHLCPACFTLRKLRAWEGRKHRGGFRGDVVLQGTDPQHDVVATGTGDDWRIEIALQGQADLVVIDPAPPAAVQWLRHAAG